MLPGGTIFVAIPSFRDAETQHTIENLFDTAKDPLRVFVGVFYQLSEEDNESCFRIPYKFPENVREERVDAAEATGPCFARFRVQKMYQGEDFYLSLDSHMRMVHGWDTLLIEQLGKCPSEKPILTTYPVGYQLPEGKDVSSWRDAIIPSEKRPPFLCFSGFGEKDGMPRFAGRLLRRIREEPIRTCFCVSGFAFSRGSVVGEVPYAPNLPFLFFGEEALMSARLYTHGYDFFCPGQTVTYHLWERKHRPFFKSQANVEHVRQEDASLARAKRLLLGEEVDELYGLGKERPVSGFWKQVGVDFDAKTSQASAELGGLKEEDFARSEAEETLAKVLGIMQGRGI